MDSKARSRIEALLDAQSFVEIGALVKSRSTDFLQGTEKAASDGVICGYGSISGKPVYIYAQNRDVLSGSVGEMHGRKIAHLYDMAMKMGAPVVELLDSSGIRLEEATDALYALSKLYKKKAQAKGLIPLYSVLYGQAGGGMALLASLSDFCFMENQEGRLFINAPDAVKGNKDASFSEGKAQEEAGNVDFSGTEEEIVKELQKAFTFLPANNEDAAYNEDADDNLNRAVDGFFDLKGREALTILSDEGEIFEVKRAYGEEAVTAFIRLNGQTVGGIATNGGALHWKDIAKMNRFIRFCNTYSLPILTLCDTTGFENCLCNEKHLGTEMAELLSAYGNASVPMVTVVKKELALEARVSVRILFLRTPNRRFPLWNRGLPPISCIRMSPWKKEKPRQSAIWKKKLLQRVLRLAVILTLLFSRKKQDKELSLLWTCSTGKLTLIFIKSSEAFKWRKYEENKANLYSPFRSSLLRFSSVLF